MYTILCQHDIVESFRNAPTAFQRVGQHHGTALSIAYFKSHKVKVCERGYTILGDVGDTHNKKYMGDVDLRFVELDVLPKESMDRIFGTMNEGEDSVEDEENNN